MTDTPVKHRRFRLHFIGPAPYGASLHTCVGITDLSALLADGWRLYRINPIPRHYWAPTPLPRTWGDI